MIRQFFCFVILVALSLATEWLLGNRFCDVIGNRFFATQAKVETVIISQSTLKPLVWKRFIDDIFTLWNTTREGILQFIEQANKHHPTIKFTAEISDSETNFLDTIVYKGERFKEESVLDLRTHFKPTETFQYTHFSSCHQYGVKRGFIKGEALRLLRTNSSKTLFEENIKKIQITPSREGVPRGFYPKDPFRSEVQGQEPSTPTKTKRTKENLAFCNEIPSSSA